MVLQEGDVTRITEFVKGEPRTVQDVAKHIGRSWVTTDSYIRQIKERTGLVDVKTFRKGTQAALKIVFYNHGETMITDSVREGLFYKIRHGRTKHDFDFMEVFQYIPEGAKKAFLEEYNEADVSVNQQIIALFRQAQSVVYCFSGNLSFVNMEENGVALIDVMEELLKRKVHFKILSRVSLASVSNLEQFSHLVQKYPGLIEIKHCYQPLRGFIIDDRIGRFKNEEHLSFYRKGELNQSTRVFYEVLDVEWIGWLQKVFWSLFRGSLDHNTRLKEINRIF